MWSCKVTWQAKIIISPLLSANKVTWSFDHVILWDHVTRLKHYIPNITVLMVTKFGRMVTCGAAIIIVTRPFNHVVFFNHVTNLKHLYCYNKFGHETCAKWQSTAHKVTWSLSQVILWGHLNIYILHISTCTRPMTAKHGKMVTHHEGLSPINLHNLLKMRL